MTDPDLTPALLAPVAEYVRACNASQTDALPAELVLTHYFNVADGHVTLLVITHNDPTPPGRNHRPSRPVQPRPWSRS